MSKTVSAMSKPSGRNLWDLASAERSDDEDTKASYRSACFIGSRNCGKTSLVLRFLDREEAPKPTTALEYTFGRRTRGHNLAKNVAHIWELGGGIWLSTLLDQVLTPDQILTTAVVLVLDLSLPNELWMTLDTLLSSIRCRIAEISSGNRDLEQTLKQMAAAKVADHTDRDLLNILPIPIVIVGGKYDLFQELKPEERKMICKTLRFVAHDCGASLQFQSVKQDSLLNKAKVAVSHLVFDTTPLRTLQLDHSKPLLVPFGMDSLQEIGSFPATEATHQARTPYDMWKNSYLSHFPQEAKGDPSKAADPAVDPQYRETAVDDLRVQKADELERYRKYSDRRSVEAMQALKQEA